MIPRCVDFLMFPNAATLDSQRTVGHSSLTRAAQRFLRRLIWTTGLLYLPFGQADAIYIPDVGGQYSIQVTSFKSARFVTVTRQEYDFSCGSAAVASLLTHHYQKLTSEKEVFEFMFAQGDQQRIKREGFSMLDMKNFLDSRGYSADGFRISLDKLRETTRVPAIVLINTRGYSHFVVVKGLRDDEILLGDPALGLVVMPRTEFEGVWNGLAFMIRTHAELGRAHFNRPSEWAVHQKAPLNSFARPDLATFTLTLGAHR